MTAANAMTLASWVCLAIGAMMSIVDPGDAIGAFLCSIVLGAISLAMRAKGLGTGS